MAAPLCQALRSDLPAGVGFSRRVEESPQPFLRAPESSAEAARTMTTPWSRVSPEDISVVVQGPIVGRDHWPPSKRLTERCLASIRHQLPGAEIILSTWRN